MCACLPPSRFSFCFPKVYTTLALPFPHTFSFPYRGPLAQFSASSPAHSLSLCLSTSLRLSAVCLLTNQEAPSRQIPYSCTELGQGSQTVSSQSQPHLLESSLTSVFCQRNLAASQSGEQATFKPKHIPRFLSRCFPLPLRTDAPVFGSRPGLLLQSTGPPFLDVEARTSLQIERQPSSLFVASVFLRLVSLGRSAPILSLVGHPRAACCVVLLLQSYYYSATTVPYTSWEPSRPHRICLSGSSSSPDSLVPCHVWVLAGCSCPVP